MTLRRRVGAAAALAVAVAVVLVAVISYFVVRGQLRGQVDNALRAQAATIERNPFSLSQPLPTISASAGGPAPYVQLVAADGTKLPRQGSLPLPAGSRVRAVAAGAAPAYLTDIRVRGSHLRMFTFPDPRLMTDGQPIAIQLARPLSEVDHVLASMRLILLLLCLGGVGLAMVLGRLAARRVLAPLAEVADTAQHIGQTEDLASRIRVHADDEVGQLAGRFNAMLERLESSRGALDDSVRSQRQLVADASHELRTPITSLRTNVELLLAHEQLAPDERRRILADVVEQTEELTALVGDLIDLARGEAGADSVDSVRLDRLVEESLDRARRNFPHTEFVARLEPVVLDGSPERLGRAVNNLLDNAALHAPGSETVEVTVDGDGLRVRDHGPGIAPADLPHVFDRFYRGSEARGHQGTGLGLAIVRQVAEQHDGSVQAANAPDGGAVFILRLPVSPAEGSEDRARARAPSSADSPQPPPSGDGGPDDPSLTRGPEAVA